jgi:hypothetical protein
VVLLNKDSNLAQSRNGSNSIPDGNYNFPISQFKISKKIMRMKNQFKIPQSFNNNWKT